MNGKYNIILKCETVMFVLFSLSHSGFVTDAQDTRQDESEANKKKNKKSFRPFFRYSVAKRRKTNN